MAEGHLEHVAIAPDEHGERLDRVLAAHSALSRSRLKALILAGEVTVADQMVSDPGYHVKAGDAVTVHVPPPEPAEPEGEAIPLNVVHEDDDLIVIDKPAGLVVHPAAGNWTGTLVNALIAHCGASLSGIGGVRRPGIVHRLDKDTTGLMVVAKNDRAHQALAAQFADHGRTGPLVRELSRLCVGRAGPAEGHHRRADRPASPRPRQARRAQGRARGHHPLGGAGAAYQGNDGKPVASLIACRLETGRTHQIRVHLAHIGHPLLGDDAYGAGFKTKESHLSEPARRRARGPWQAGPCMPIFLASSIHQPVDFLEFRSELPADLARLRHILFA